MRRQGAQLSAIAPTDNLRYLLGFAPKADERPCVLLVSEDDAAMVMPELNADQTAAALPGLPLLRWADADGAQEALSTVLHRLDVPEHSTVLVDPEMRADHLLALVSASETGLTPADGSAALAALREVKDAGELEDLAASAASADDAVRAAFAACTPGATEQEVADAVEASLREAGAEPQFAIIGAGPNGAFPHHHTGDRPLRDGDAVVIDIGGRLRGYMSDITRMAVIGEPSDRYREIHAIVEAAVVAALAAARPGAACGDVDRAARAVIEDAGYGHCFLHRTGHGLGLSVHESPWIMAGEATILRPGVVHSIEPGIYLHGEFGVRLEEIVRITDEGCASLSALPRDVQVVNPSRVLKPS